MTKKTKPGRLGNLNAGAGHKKEMVSITFKVKQAEYDAINESRMAMATKFPGMKFTIQDYIRLLLEFSVFAHEKTKDDPDALSDIGLTATET